MCSPLSIKIEALIHHQQVIHLFSMRELVMYVDQTFTRVLVLLVSSDVCFQGS